MKLNLDWSNHGLSNFWAQYGDLTILLTGAGLMVALVVGAYRLYRTEAKSKSVANIAALFTMAWTGYGLVHVALHNWHVPPAFAIPSFAVYEVMLLAAVLRAEENRRSTGEPGSAGRYAFLIALSQGVVGASGAANLGEGFMRLTLPILAVGLWYVLLVSEREADKDEWKEARAKRAADREATWVWTPRTVGVRLRLIRPGDVTLSQAEREAKVKRMVELADTIAIINGMRDPGYWAKRKLDKTRRTLREQTRDADQGIVDEVAEKTLRAARAEALMVPGAGDPPVGKWAKDLKGPKPPNPGNPEQDQADDDEVPVSGAPAGSKAEQVPALVDADTWAAHRARVELVMATVGDAWWSGPKAMSVDVIQALGKDLLAKGKPNEGLANRLNAGKTASCLRLARYARLAPEHFKTLQASNPGLEIPEFVSK